MQHYDPEIASSKIERMCEHEHASLSSFLIGDHVSRYFINDGIAAVDYLSALFFPLRDRRTPNKLSRGSRQKASISRIGSSLPHRVPARRDKKQWRHECPDHGYQLLGHLVGHRQRRKGDLIGDKVGHLPAPVVNKGCPLCCDWPAD
jgi:hypothetical protein